MAPCFMGDADPSLHRLQPPPEETGDDIFLVSHEVSRRRPGVAAVLSALRKLFKEHQARLAGRTAEKAGELYSHPPPGKTWLTIFLLLRAHAAAKLVMSRAAESAPCA